MKLLLNELSEVAGSLVRVILAILVVFNVVLYVWAGREPAVLSVTVTAIGLTLIMVQLVRRTQRTLLTEIRNGHDQSQSFVNLLNVLNPRRALPLFPLYGATVLPDLAVSMASIIQTRRPHVIVELGSGASTIILGYSARAVGASVWSLEHDLHYMQKTAQLVRDHELDDVVTIVHAPLTDLKLEGKTWRWYEIGALQGVDRIDMLFVDGPPAIVQTMARYPALPILMDRLSNGSFAILDDVVRPDERRIVEEWKTRFPDLTVEPLGVGKGGVLLYFASSPRDT